MNIWDTKIEWLEMFHFSTVFRSPVMYEQPLLKKE